MALSEMDLYAKQRLMEKWKVGFVLKLSWFDQQNSNYFFYKLINKLGFLWGMQHFRVIFGDTDLYKNVCLFF